MLQVHPLCDIFPVLSDEEIAKLSADLLSKGQMEPIVMYEGKILDGRNRYKVLSQQGVAVKQVQYQGKDPAGFVISKNLRRRHLSAADRAQLEVRVRSWAPPHRPNGHPHAVVNSDPAPVFTNKQMAQEAGVSTASISRAKRVEKGTPDPAPKKQRHRIHPAKAAIKKTEVLQMELDGEKEQRRIIEEENVVLSKQLEELKEKADVILADEPEDSLRTKIWNEAAHATAEKVEAVSGEAKLQTILTERNKAMRRMDGQLRNIKKDLEALLPHDGIQEVLNKYWK